MWANLAQPDTFLNAGLSIKALSIGNYYIGIQDDANNAVMNPAI